MSERLNELYDILKEVDKNLKLEDYKTKLLKIKELFTPIKEESDKSTGFSPKEQETNNELIEEVLKGKRFKLSIVYNHYKYKLITKQQKEEIKNTLINNDYINVIKNKNDKVVGYEINKDKQEDLKKWLIDNLISIN